jgi:hypothetical protein
MPENDNPALHASTADRLTAGLLALFLGYFFVLGPIQQVWRDHWLVKDGQRGTATVVRKHWGGHGVVIYEYRVGNNVYTGQDRRARVSPHFDLIVPGEKTLFYFSSSHPWLSALDLPRFVGIDGLSVVLLVWSFEIGLINTVVKPKSRWAFGSHNQRHVLGTHSLPSREGWELFKDRARLVSCGVLVVLVMGAVEFGINAVFGRR